MSLTGCGLSISRVGADFCLLVTLISTCPRLHPASSCPEGEMLGVGVGLGPPAMHQRRWVGGHLCPFSGQDSCLISDPLGPDRGGREAWGSSGRTPERHAPPERSGRPSWGPSDPVGPCPRPVPAAPSPALGSPVIP